MKSTNYFDAFIKVAADCPARVGEVPPAGAAPPTIATLQFEMVFEHPYAFTSDDVIFEVFAIRNDVPASRRVSERERFFSKGQPCMRSSPLPKRYGWGVHFDANGRLAIFGVDSPEYEACAADRALRQLVAMATRRA